MNLAESGKFSASDADIPLIGIKEASCTSGYFIPVLCVSGISEGSFVPYSSAK